jgi:HEAT repeats
MVGTVKKKYIYILGTAFALCLVALVAVGSLEARTRYYTPVVSSAGDKIAYVKRHYRVWASGGGLIPFMGGKPYRERVLSDRIQLCVKDLKTGRVKVIEDWKPRQVKTSGLISITPVLNWELEELRYVISLRVDEDPGVGIFRRPYAYLTNLEKWSGLKAGPTEADTVRVRLETKPEGRLSKGNAVVVEKTWDRKTALPVIRQKLEGLIEEQGEAVQDPAQRERVQNLSQFVAGQEDHQLPEKLTALFLDESGNATGVYPDLTPAVIQLGETAIEPLLKQYDRSSPGTRRATLAIFGEIGSTTALTLVRREIRTENPDLQSAAVVALRRTKGDRAGEELALLLNDTRLPSQVRTEVLGQLTQTTGSAWSAHVLDASLGDPVIFKQLPDIVPDLDYFPERLIWFRLKKIYSYLESENPRSVSTAQQLIGRIRFWNHLSELGPVVEDLLKARYDYGRTTDATGKLVDTGSKPTDDRVVWDRGLANDMLENIEKKVEFPSQWLSKNIRDPDNLLTLLYVEDLLYKRKGQKIINRPPVEAQLEVSVRDDAGAVQAVGHRFVKVERPVTLQCKPVKTGFPQPTCEGLLFIDKDNWRLTFNPLVMRLADCTMTALVSIPFGGACEIKMEARHQGKPQKYTWTLRHIDGPRQR